MIASIVSIIIDLVCICFPTPGRGLPYGSGLGLSRCLGPGECLHSFIIDLSRLQTSRALMLRRAKQSRVYLRRVHHGVHT